MQLHEHQAELPLLRDLIVLNQCKKIVEIGVWIGESTTFLCQGAISTGGHVWGFDWWEQTGPNFANLAGRRERTRLKVQRMHNPQSARGYITGSGIPDNVFDLIKINTATELPRFTTYLAQNCAPIDFCFIDACHSYAGVSNDFFAVYPYLSPTGIIAFHDTYNIDGCREFILDLRSKFFDGTFDIVDFPFGLGDRRVGISLLVKRCYHKIGRPMDEICNPEDRRAQIEAKERSWYESQESLYNTSANAKGKDKPN